LSTELVTVLVACDALSTHRLGGLRYVLIQQDTVEQIHLCYLVRYSIQLETPRGQYCITKQD
jgi:hypothetical protein